jgi:hypothetical protein
LSATNKAAKSCAGSASRSARCGNGPCTERAVKVAVPR